MRFNTVIALAVAVLLEATPATRALAHESVPVPPELRLVRQPATSSSRQARARGRDSGSEISDQG
jgi:hypothetical protein